MSRVSLDLKQFKHVKSDDKSTTLQHKDGHMLTMAHKALSPEFQKQLQALCDADKSANPKDGGKMADKPKMAKGGEVKNPKLEQSKQQPRKMLAEGADPMGAPEAATDTIPKEPMRSEEPTGLPVPTDFRPPQPMTEDPALAAKAQAQELERSLKPQDEGLQAIKDVYNQKLAGSGVPMTAADMFGPNGEPPQNPVNPTLWQAAENSNEAEKFASQQIAQRQQISKENSMFQRQQAEHDAAVAQNVVNAKLGIPLVPDPGAPVKPGEEQIPETVIEAQAEKPEGLPQAGPQQPAQAAGESPESQLEKLMSSGYKKQMAGIEGTAAAQAKLGEEQAVLLNNQVKAQREGQMAYKEQYNALEAERQAHMADIKAGHINPEKYWENHSKIAAGIGMILAGFNPTNNPNAAVNFLKYQMDQNIEAQKQNLASEQNLLKANLDQFRNLKDATDMTRIMQTDIMINELKGAAAKATSPMAKAAALQAAGKLQMEVAPMFQQFAMKRAMMQLSSGGGSPQSMEQMMSYMRVMNPEMAKSMEQRYVPTVGLSSIPVPDKVREEIIAKQGLDAEAKDLLDYSKKHTNIVPGTAEYNFGVTKALALQQKIREAMLGTVFRDSEKPLLEKFVNENPAGALKYFSTQPQLRAILESNSLSLNTLKRGYGLPTKQSAPQADARAQAEAFIRQNPNHPMAQKIRNHPKFKGE